MLWVTCKRSCLFLVCELLDTLLLVLCCVIRITLHRWLRAWLWYLQYVRKGDNTALHQVMEMNNVSFELFWKKIHENVKYIWRIVLEGPCRAWMINYIWQNTVVCDYLSLPFGKQFLYRYYRYYSWSFVIILLLAMLWQAWVFCCFLLLSCYVYFEEFGTEKVLWWQNVMFYVKALSMHAPESGGHFCWNIILV